MPRKPWTIARWFIFFLSVSDAILLNAVDLYNEGGLSKNARLALEFIDGCDGPGDVISNPT